MRMSALEKHFVNSPRHAQRVADHAYQLLSHIDCKSGWQYLDVGCGVGTAARKIAATSELRVIGIDIDPKQIEAAKSLAARPNLQYKVMDATKLEFTDGAFDVVASSMATHHIPDWGRALSEMLRVLRPGGYLIYSDFVVPSWLAKAAGLIRFVGFPTTSELRLLRERAELVVIHESHRFGKVDVIWRKNGRSNEAGPRNCTQRLS
jgi:ubiquinone/menaquinone biosynthesis C-methylase UbiE